MEVEDYLRSKGLVVKQAGPNNVHVLCMFCREEGGRRGRLYINVDPSMYPPGLFDCKLCGRQGAYNTIRKHYGDPTLDDDGNEFAKGDGKPVVSRSRVLNAAAAYFHQCLADVPEVFAYLQHQRGLSTPTIMDHQLGWANGTLRKHLHSEGFKDAEIFATKLVNTSGEEFYTQQITIPYMIHGQVVQIRGKDLIGKAKYRTPPGDKVQLYNTDAAWGAHKLIVTEGEFDALVLEQLGYNAVGVPGANGWQAAWNGLVEDVHRVYTCYDRDKAGDEGRKRTEKHLPNVRHITMPDHVGDEQKNDPTEWIIVKHHTREEFEALVNGADGSIVHTVDEAYAAWKEMEGDPDRKRLKLGFGELDGYLGGGMQPGQVMVVLAKTGAGKTLFLINLFNRLLRTKDQQDKKILFLSLEQERNEWFERALKIFRFWAPSASHQDVLDYYRDRLMIADKNKLTQSQVYAAVEDFHVATGSLPDLIAVDYLGYWARAYPGEGYQRTTDAIMAMKEMAKELKIPFITPHQVSRVADKRQLDLSSARDSGAVEETADFVLGLSAVYDKEEGEGGVRDVKSSDIVISVLKSRQGGADKQVRLAHAPLSLTFVARDSELAKSAQAEWTAYSGGGITSELIHLRHLVDRELHDPRAWSVAKQKNTWIAQLTQLLDEANVRYSR